MVKNIILGYKEGDDETDDDMSEGYTYVRTDRIGAIEVLSTDVIRLRMLDSSPSIMIAIPSPYAFMNQYMEFLSDSRTAMAVVTSDYDISGDSFVYGNAIYGGD